MTKKLTEEELMQMALAVESRDPIGWKARNWIPKLVKEILELREENENLKLGLKALQEDANEKDRS